MSRRYSGTTHSKYGTIEAKQSQLPLHSTHTINKQLFTPMRSHSKSTNQTRPATLSLYEMVSRKKPESQSRKMSSVVGSKVKQYSMPKSKVKQSKQMNRQKLIQVKSKKPPKSTKTKQKQPKKAYDLQNYSLNTDERFRSNKQSLRGARQSHSSQIACKFLRKVSEVFDYVTLRHKLPYQVESLLEVPLRRLRTTLQLASTYSIGRSLTDFKNDCMDLYRTFPQSKLMEFIRVPMPTNSRWVPLSTSNRSIRESERSSRDHYYSSLQPKRDTGVSADERTLNRIENRLSQYLGKSFGRKKVYI